MIIIKRKILFGITSLEFGGAERVLVDLANKLSDRYDVRIFSIYGNGALQGELQEGIKVNSFINKKYTELSWLQKRLSVFKILFFGKSVFKKYISDDSDVQISFLEGPVTRLFSNGKKTKIAWVHNDIKSVFGSGIKAFFKKKLDRSIYRKYDKLVFVSKDNMESFKSEYSDISEDKMNVIYNYIDANLVREKASNGSVSDVFKNDKGIKLVSVCRLVEQKAVDRFIEVHAKLVKNGYKHTVYIIGDGPEHAKLNDLIKAKGVEDSFILLGKSSNPYPYICGADVFCLLSYFEGYGMVIDEAKILDKKIVITDTAAREAVNGYPKATIVSNDVEGIYNGLLKVLKENDSTAEATKAYKYNNENIIQDVIKMLGES